ncbi:MAG: hypothetical protein SPK97_05790 [Bacteroidales bacterium]|nr:hypothetical protein [Bacteroidales bacterium]
MARVTYSAGIDSVSGALSKPSKSGQHSCSKMLLATHRVAATQSNACNRLYLRNKVERSTPMTSNELDARARFAAVAAAVKARKSDLNKITTDQQNFAAQKDQAGGKKTMKAYLWKVCGQEYDAAHNG